jgi:hypothetical protein
VKISIFWDVTACSLIVACFPYSSTVKIGARRSYETSVNLYQITLCLILVRDSEALTCFATGKARVNWECKVTSPVTLSWCEVKAVTCHSCPDQGDQGDDDRAGDVSAADVEWMHMNGNWV